MSEHSSLLAEYKFWISFLGTFSNVNDKLADQVPCQ